MAKIDLRKKETYFGGCLIMNKKLIYDIGDKPKFGSLLIFALQQLLAILAATIAVPTIIGIPTQIPAAIFGAGVGTLVYQLFTKFKSPVFLGSSFAFLGSLGVAVAYGYCGILLGSVVAGLVYVLIDFKTGLCNTGRISQRQIVGSANGHFGNDGELAAPLLMLLK